jgi:hypothetical protein
VLAALSALSGCGAAPAPEATIPRRAPGLGKPGAVALSEVPALRATEIARVPGVTYGPYLGTREEGALVLWAPIEGAERRFKAVVLNGRGTPKGEAFGVGTAPEKLGVVAVRALGAGYGVVYTRQAAPGAGELLEALCLDASGKPLDEASVLGPLTGSALWVEAVPTAAGALVFYALRGADKRRAEIWATALDAKCHAAQKGLVARDALAWQAVKLGGGAVVALVQAAEGPLGTVVVVQVDAAAKVLGSTAVSAPASAELDLDAVSLGDRALLAWTDRRALDPRVFSALVDAGGKLVAPPDRFTAPDGEQALIRLVPPMSGGPAYAAWERISLRPTSGRHIALAALGPEGRPSGATVELDYASEDGGVPEFAAAPKGLSVLTLAPACVNGKACDPDDLGPFFVRLDERMAPVASEPLRLSSLRGARAELGFGLGCTRDGCFAISALSRAPAPVFATELEARSRAFRAPIRPLTNETTPRVLEHESVSAPDSVAGFALDSAGGKDEKDYLAYVTDFDPTTPWRKLDKPAPDGRYEPVRAQVVLERLTSAGPRLSEAAPASPISLRAQSVGGVALSHGDPTKDEMLLAWAGLDAGVPQVFLTLVGKGGAKLSQRMLTRKKGDLGDIAAAWVGDGWVIAWVDERAGDPEVFATKVDARLNRIVPEQRLTNAAGTASDLSLVFDGKALRLAWSDARVAELPGQADIYTALLKPRDASRDGDEQRVAATRAHSFGPRLATYQGGFALGWVERGEEGAPGAVAVATFAADGRTGPAAQPFALGSGEPRALAIECAGPGCHLAVVSEDREKEQVQLVGVDWSASGPGNTAPLLPIAGSAATGVSPVFWRGDLLFVDSGQDGTRIRRAKVKW